MKQSLEFRLGQQLTITPQLQQAIRLLQLSSVELQQEVQEALESNPLLEEAEESPESQESRTTDAAGSEDNGSLEPTDLHMESSSNDNEDADYSGEAQGTDWENYTTTASRGSGQDSDDAPDIDARNSAPESLADHLEWQVHMSPFSDRDREIAFTLIDSINEDGYLSSSLEDIQGSLEQDPDEPVELDEIEAVLHRIQQFDPLGVGARDLAECLQIQLRILDPETPHLKEALVLAQPQPLNLLASRDTSGLRRLLKISQEDLQEAIILIQSLNPRPGSSIHASQAAYVIPDIHVRKKKGIWRAELNQESAPRLQLNRVYEKMLKNGKSGDDKKYLQDQMQQAKWFIKSLNSRNDTLLKVARMIVDRQRGFFDHGPEAMKPLVLHDIAEAVEMHESTISRVTTNKYMLTPRGVFELKYFFSSHVGTADGGTCSATAIRSLIKKMVENEPPRKPISDSKIAKTLEDQGIHVARRTVAKYRESMNIPPSNQRKSLI